MNSLKQKLAVSYALLIVIILAVSGWAIYHLVHLGRSVDVILVNNYKSILASENMKEALERIDSSAMFLVASHVEKAKAQFAESEIKFEDNYQVAANNITEPGEAEIVNDINNRYAAYRQAMVMASERAQAESLKAEVSTAIVATLGLALALGFAWRFTTYVVRPISL